MHVEIHVALNFLISFLYNKLPRRRVNQFGEELGNALKLKFEGHWYPEKPYKGSAFRCLKTTPPLDPVFEIAAREAGMDLNDIQNNLPQELSIWIDPGEVSYRMSEKGPVKILYSEYDRSIDPENPDREVIRTFNPEAQCFKPIETTAVSFGALSLSPGNGSGNGSFGAPIYKPCATNVNGFLPKSSGNVTFTTATFAQTKFGSTKLKSNTKRANRMSPTEFSNYIKQRALQQQAASQVNIGPVGSSNTLYSTSNTANGSPQNSRSISPIHNSLDSVSNLMFLGNNCPSPSSPSTSSPPSLSSLYAANQQTHYTSSLIPQSSSSRAGFSNTNLANDHLADILGSTHGKASSQSNQLQSNVLSRFASFLDKASPYISVASTSPSLNNSSLSSSGFASSTTNTMPTLSGDSTTSATSNGKAFDNFTFNLNGVSYPNQYQHLLVAN